MRNLFMRLAKVNSGTKMIEYGLIAVGVSVAITTVVDHIGTDLNTIFTSASMGLQ